MSTIATWIREIDEPFFERWFLDQPVVRVVNARRAAPAAPSEPLLAPEVRGLLLSGGPDIAAEFLAQPVPHPGLIEEPQPERDRWEFGATREALERGLPIFAICKGVQVLNVALGGTLHLDISGHNDPALRLHNAQPIDYAGNAPASTRFERVNSSHHQALDRLGDGLFVEAWSPGDGIIEQVRRRDYPYCFGVQYHPERHTQYAPLFAEFFAQTASR